MPTFTFTDPQGKTHDVTGPPGSTPQQAFAILQQQLGGTTPQAPRPPAPAPDPSQYDPTEGMSWGHKALVNLGAGIDTTWQGAKQLVGQGMTDEQLQEKRRMDQHLADQTAGGGLIQLAGEIAPTIPLGMGAGAAATRIGGLARAAAASPSLSAAGGGALQGALQPVTSDESRLQNTGLGAAGGMVAPTALKLALKGGGAVGRGVGGAAQRFAAAIPEDAALIGGIGARAAEAQGGKRAATVIKDATGNIIPADQYVPHAAVSAQGGRPSAAVATQDSALASLEQGSRTGGGQHWLPFDTANKEARWNALDKGLQDQPDLDKALANANQIGAGVKQIYHGIPETPFFTAMDDFYQKLQVAKASPQYLGNPAVKSAVDYVEKAMHEAGTVTPELLHNLRRTVAQGLTGVPGMGDAGVRAASNEPFVISLAHAMDQVLDASSTGGFGAWKSDYAKAMGKAEAAKADMRVRGKFFDEATGTPLKPVTGLTDIPDVTPAALKQAIKVAGNATRGPQRGQNLLSNQSTDLLQGVRKDLDAQALLQRAKAAKTGGSGSDTASNISDLARMVAMEHLVPGSTLAKVGWKMGGQNTEQAMQRQLAELLQDPAKLRAFVAAQERQRLLRAAGPNIPQPGMIGMSMAGVPAMAGAGQQNQ
jgi:hypothetical protein